MPSFKYSVIEICAHKAPDLTWSCAEVQVRKNCYCRAELHEVRESHLGREPALCVYSSVAFVLFLQPAALLVTVIYMHV